MKRLLLSGALILTAVVFVALLSGGVRADDKEFRARLRLDTPREREYFRHGGILQYVLRRLLSE